MKPRARWLCLVSKLLLFAIFICALYNLFFYDESEVCSSSETVSRECITLKSGEVAEGSPRERRDQHGTAYEYYINATWSDKTVVVTLFPSRDDLTPGTPVTLSYWQGRLMSISANGHQTHLRGWYPGFSWFIIPIANGTMLVLLMLTVCDFVQTEPKRKISRAIWRFKAQAFDTNLLVTMIFLTAVIGAAFFSSLWLI